MSAVISHTVFVVDNSGSMRTADVDNAGAKITRHDAIFDAILNTFFKDRLTQQEINRGAADIFSMIIMNEESLLVFEQKGRAAARDLIRGVQQSSCPRSHGNYLPALAQLEALMKRPIPAASRKSVVNVFFLSDGKPSDTAPKGAGSIQEKVLEIIVCKTKAALSSVWSSRTFTFHAAGFGNEDFIVLEQMALSIPESRGTFHRTGLAVSALRATMSSFSTSITESVTNADSSAGRKLRDVVKSPTKLHSFTWVSHCAVGMFGGKSLAMGGEWEHHGNIYDVMISNEAFDSGGERNVFHFRITNDRFPNKAWVAKENKYDVHQVNDIKFHRGNVTTQHMAAKYAATFNTLLQSCLSRDEIYSIQYGECYLCLIGPRSFFVEPFYEGKFQKWNTNSGGVKTAPITKTNLGAILEGDSDEEEDEDCFQLHNYEYDIPQAFSHWTEHTFSKRNRDGTITKRLVCDLQGWFDKTSKTFQLIDPVIHSEKKGKFGRTDRGIDGISDFFKTHKCSRMCSILGLPLNEHFQGLLHQKDCIETSKSLSTSQITVVKSNHLQQRQKERVITTRELQSAVKHGSKQVIRSPELAATRIIHDYDGVSYITDAFSRVGITGYRGAKPL